MTNKQVTENELANIISKHNQIQAAHTSLEAGLNNPAAAVALPDDFRLHDLEDYRPHARRMRGRYTTQSIAAFVRYALTHADKAGAAIFLNPQEMNAKAVLDLGDCDNPGHRAHTANLISRQTAAYEALNGVVGRCLSQRKAAEFFEDWVGHIDIEFFGEPTNPDEGLPTITARRAIAALRNITIDTARRLESEVQALGSAVSAFEAVQASSKDEGGLPTTIRFTCKPYADLAPRTFELRLSVQAGEKAPEVLMRIKNAEQHQEAMGEELAQLMQTTIDNAPGEDKAQLSIFLGSFS